MTELFKLKERSSAILRKLMLSSAKFITSWMCFSVYD